MILHIQMISWENSCELSSDQAAVADFRQYLEHRFLFCLGKFGARVGRIHVQFEDLTQDLIKKTPAETIEETHKKTDEEILVPVQGTKRCVVTLQLQPSGTITLEEWDTDLTALIDRIADRLARAVGREIYRRSAL